MSVAPAAAIMPSSLPVLVLVPGAFGIPEGFAKLLPYLAEADITTQPGGYRNADPEDPTIATCANDIGYLCDHVLLPLLDGQQKRCRPAHPLLRRGRRRWRV